MSGPLDSFFYTSTPCGKYVVRRHLQDVKEPNKGWFIYNVEATAPGEWLCVVQEGITTMAYDVGLRRIIFDTEVQELVAALKIYINNDYGMSLAEFLNELGF